METEISGRLLITGDLHGDTAALTMITRQLRESCRVEFFHYSRPEKRFSSIEALKEQLMKDAEKGKAYFQSFEK